MMNNKLLLAFALISSGNTYAQKVQEKNVPDVVKAEFIKQFPIAKEVS